MKFASKNHVNVHYYPSESFQSDFSQFPPMKATSLQYFKKILSDLSSNISLACTHNLLLKYIYSRKISSKHHNNKIKCMICVLLNQITSEIKLLKMLTSHCVFLLLNYI